MCYGEQCCVYGRNRQTVQCGTVSVLYCVTVCILVLGVECVTVSSVVFMEGTDYKFRLKMNVETLRLP